MAFAEGVPTVEIHLAGRSFTLGWTWGAKRRVQEVLATRGLALTDAAGIAENLAVVFWACLDKEARAEVAIEDVEEMVHPGNEIDVATKLGELFKVSEPDPDPNAQPAAGKREPTAGRSPSKMSGQSVSSISG